MNTRNFILVILIVLVGGLIYAYEQGLLSRLTDNGRAFVFTCAEGETIKATFANSQVDLVLSDGRTLILPQVMSASGARYANTEESFVFWNKGNTAFVEENGKMTIGGCVNDNN
ncbi:MAG: MliC family protein [Candidatus Vogelbacteria bacterium]|nr:MliC family protein [Candidatus Vogelbacteria bacterium]